MRLRGAAVVYATHIFDQADKWATHVAFMQLDKKLSPVLPPPRLRALSRDTLAGPAKIAPIAHVCAGPRELERQYRAHSHLFDADNQCLTDVIMAEQACEKAADRHFSESGKGYEAGRVARAMAVESMDEHRRKRREEEKARELLAKA